MLRVDWRPRVVRQGASVAALLGAAVALAACGSGGGASGGSGSGGGGGGGETMSIGLLPITGDAPAFMGINRGFFSRQGLQMKKQVMEGGSDIIAGVASGNLDVGFSNNISLVIAASKGLPIKILTPGLQANGTPETNEDAIVAPTDGSIKRVSQLAGKTIAVNNVDNLGTFSVNYALEQAGVDYHNVHYVEVPFPDMPAAITSGRVDAAWIAEPFLTALKVKHAVRVLSTTPATIAPYFPESSYFTSTQFYESHRDQVDRFVKGMTASLSYAGHHPQAVRKAIPTYTKVSADLANKMTLGEWKTGLQPDLIQRTVELCKKYGYIDKAPDLDSLIVARNAGS